MVETKSTRTPIAMLAEVFQIAGDCGAPTTIVMGYTDCLSSWILPVHSHDRYEVHMVTSGNFLYAIDSETFRLNAGDLCLTKPGEPHSMRTEDGTSGQIIHVQLDEIRPEQVALAFQRAKIRTVRDCSELIPILRMAITELEQPGPLCQIMVSALVCQSLVYLSRRIWRDEEFSTSPRYVRDSIISDALWYMESNCRHGITVDEIARAVGVSRSLLAHRFTKVLKESVCHHSKRLVMQRARRLIEEDQMLVCEVADLLGFPSSNHFSSSFKGYFGVSPSQHRVSSRTRDIQ